MKIKHNKTSIISLDSHLERLTKMQILIRSFKRKKTISGNLYLKEVQSQMNIIITLIN